ncbi:unnamed protein product [Durusdinium trenchii]|uniref:HTH La-type RNA-binding domain-containing protein n=1 Tax=Durusdinium trenchii TaxID=1381693 RepID=A0ABP0Q848_9DINO
MAGAETRPLRVKLRSGRGRGVLLLVPRSCELVADLQQHVQMRLEEEKIVLKVQGYALLPTQRVREVLRDGDELVSSTARGPSCTEATPALKDVELVEPMMGGMHRGTADWKEPESGDKGSKRAKIEKHHAKSGGEVHDDTRLTSWEAAHQAKEILKRARPMPPPASPPATPPAPVLPPWPPVKAKENFTLKKDGEAVAISHPVLGDLEVPSGQAPEDFVNRKLKTLSKAIRKQVEYYFSDANWAKDEYLRSLADAEGFVGIQEIMDFKLLSLGKQGTKSQPQKNIKITIPDHPWDWNM